MYKPSPFKTVLEIRYERGYRYLDRCGEAMLILQDQLPAETNSIWIPEETIPAGANIKCPNHELRVSFNTVHFVVEQTANEESPMFSAVASVAFSVISGRFDLRSFVRIGARRLLLVGADSTEQAEGLSLKLSPLPDWPPGRPEGMHAKSNEVIASFESEDGLSGFNFGIKPISKIEAPEQIDERARLPARLLEKGQKEALIEQMKRRAQREKEPNSGLLLDIDYYHVRPSKVDVAAFWQTAMDSGNKIISSFLSGR